MDTELNQQNRKIELLLFILGIGVAVLSIILGVIFPTEVAWMPRGFTTPIIAFEFLQTNQEVIQFFGADSPERTEWIEKMELGHQVDSLYLVVYGLFLAVWGWYAVKTTSNKLCYVVLLLAGLASVSDALENAQLVAICAKIETGVFTEELDRLYLFTWLKWGSLTFALVSLMPYLYKHSRLGRVISTIGVMTVIACLFAFLGRSYTTIFTLGITLQFLLLIVLSIVNLYRSRQKV